MSEAELVAAQQRVSSLEADLNRRIRFINKRMTEADDLHSDIVHYHTKWKKHKRIYLLAMYFAAAGWFTLLFRVDPLVGGACLSGLIIWFVLMERGK